MVHQLVKTNVIFEDSCLAVMHVIIKKLKELLFLLLYNHLHHQTDCHIIASSPPRQSHHHQVYNSKPATKVAR